MTTDDNHQDRRRFQRVLFEVPVNIIVGQHSVAARMIDISLRGALVQLDPRPQWPFGQAVELCVPLDNDSLEIRMQGHIVHQEGEHLGIQCDHIDMDSITHLRRLVELNLDHPELLERELKALG